MTSTSYKHGGDIDHVSRQFGVAAGDILDFSANVNPMGLPARAAQRLAREAGEARRLLNYPAPESPELKDALSLLLGVGKECIVIGAGADALIDAAIRSVKPQRCLIPVPAFSEYERACQACDCPTQSIPLSAGFLLSMDDVRRAVPGDLVILNNPHNPTGACIDRGEMLDRIAMIRSCGASVLVDEAFIDYAPAAAITCDAAKGDGVIAIRSLTKFFGCPGLRVGYAVAAPVTARRLLAQLPAWPVTTLAVSALAEALQDGDYARDTLQRNEHARVLLSAALGDLGCFVFPAAANFLLLRLPEDSSAIIVRDRLVQEHRILVRECESFEGLQAGRYLRVAVRSVSDNARLIEALTNVLGGSSCRQRTV